jgi:hypothetical protein
VVVAKSNQVSADSPSATCSWSVWSLSGVGREDSRETRMEARSWRVSPPLLLSLSLLPSGRVSGSDVGVELDDEDEVEGGTRRAEDKNEHSMLRSGLSLGWLGCTKDARCAILRPGPKEDREDRERVYDIRGIGKFRLKDEDG